MSKYKERYPWLRLINLYTGELYKNRDAMDDMLPGWDLAFGEIMCAELDAAIKEAGVERPLNESEIEKLNDNIKK